MLFATMGQSQVFLATVYAGLFSGLLYDLIALLRRLFEAGPLLNAALDLLFSLGAACALAAACIVAAYGEMRLFDLAGMAAGFCLWTLTLRPALRLLARPPARAARLLAGRLAKSKFLKKIAR